MQYDDFVSSVQARGGRPRAETETLVHATLRVLAERLTAGEDHDLRAQLPGDLQADLIPPEPEAQPFGPDEFARRVARMARVPEAEAREGMAAVLATTRDAAEPAEFGDTLAQLGREFAQLVPEPSVGQTVTSPTRTEQLTRADRRPHGVGVGPLADHPMVVALQYVGGGAALAAGRRRSADGSARTDAVLAARRHRGRAGPDRRPRLEFSRSWSPSWSGCGPCRWALNICPPRQQPARRKSLFGQPSREPRELVKPPA